VQCAACQCAAYSDQKCVSPVSVKNVAKALCEQPPTVLGMLGQVVKLVGMILTVPASAATAERSFSALQRVKTASRGTMTQARLNHLLLIHIHQDRVLNVNINNILNEFVGKTIERKNVF
jgi:hAT family C-terminal dimerisation region